MYSTKSQHHIPAPLAKFYPTNTHTQHARTKCVTLYLSEHSAWGLLLVLLLLLILARKLFLVLSYHDLELMDPGWEGRGKQKGVLSRLEA